MIANATVTHIGCPLETSRRPKPAKECACPTQKRKFSKKTTGNQSQEAEILSYRKEKVEAGTFMAYTIKYTGKTINSRGYNASEEEVWLYAPEVKNFIKLTQTQGDFLYVEELIEYSKPK